MIYKAPLKLFHFKLVQESQLSLISRAMLRVVEYFAKSLKVI